MSEMSTAKTMPATTPNAATTSAAAGSAPSTASTAVNVAPSAAAAATGVSSSTTVFPTAPSASLYVGELHPDVTEAMLYELFSQVGPVSSIRVCRDAITRRSLGYGYVNFHSVVDCERALDALNYTSIKGQPCRIMWSQRDPALRRSGAGNIFIKNLDKTIDNKTLHDTFSAFGNILSCKVVTDEAGNSRGFGYVHFETQEAADAAVSKVNGMLLNGVKVFVGPHISRRERRSKLDELKANFTNIFVKNLDEAFTEEELTRLFESFGQVQSSVIQKDENGRSRGFAFVNYTTHEAAQAAVDALNDHEIAPGRKIYVGRAQKKSERMEELHRQFESLKLERMSKFHGVNLYVKNLDEAVGEDQLRMEFTPFGNITSLKIMLDERGSSRGFGFVCYSAPEEAARAISEMNGRMINGKPLYVALAQRRDERRAQLESQFAQRAQQARLQAMAAAASSGMAIYQQGPLFYPGPAPAGAIPAAARFAPPGARPPTLPYGPAGAAMFSGRPSRPMRPYRQGPPNQSGPGGAFPVNAAGQAPGGSMPFRRPYGAGPRPGMMRRPDFYGIHHPPMAVPLTAQALAAAPLEQQKRMLGERLFPLVQSRDQEHASKITGMLLEMDNGEILHLIESPDALTSKVGEALDVLRQHQAVSVQSGPKNGEASTAGQTSA